TLTSTLFPYTTLFRSEVTEELRGGGDPQRVVELHQHLAPGLDELDVHLGGPGVLGEHALELVRQPVGGPGQRYGHHDRAPRPLLDRKSTRLNSSHVKT